MNSDAACDKSYLPTYINSRVPLKNDIHSLESVNTSAEGKISINIRF